MRKHGGWAGTSLINLKRSDDRLIVCITLKVGSAISNQGKRRGILVRVFVIILLAL